VEIGIIQIQCTSSLRVLENNISQNTDVHFALIPVGAFFILELCYIVFNIGARVMNRLKEPSSYAGLALIFNGISDCMTGNYQSGVPSIILGLVAVVKKENSAK